MAIITRLCPAKCCSGKCRLASKRCSVRENAGIVPRLSLYRFLPNPLQVISMILHSLDTESVVKSPFSKNSKLCMFIICNPIMEAPEDGILHLILNRCHVFRLCSWTGLMDFTRLAFLCSSQVSNCFSVISIVNSLIISRSQNLILVAHINLPD
jgi:hypothetical protein